MPLLLPVQTVVLPDTEPPTGAPLMVMVATVELAGVHTPLNTTARYWVVCVRLVYVCEVFVLLIVVQLAPLSIEDSQRITLPVWPDRVRVPPLLPEQADALLLTVPPTEAWVTVMVAILELTVEQPPITARYSVV